jgi:hypothetical protein
VVHEYKDYAVGTVAERFDYKTIEIVPEYKLHSRNRRDIVTFGDGLSYSFGENKYYKPIGIIPYTSTQTYDEIMFNTKRNAYFGSVCDMAYTHFFCHNRIGIGPEARYRYYLGLNEGGLDCNANLKVNF